MAKWVAQELEGLLVKINEVPFTDDREKRQLTIIMNGFAQLTNQSMEKAATKTRKQMRGWSLDGAAEDSQKGGSLKDIRNRAALWNVRSMGTQAPTN